jgi:hypothetical protein
MVLRYGPPLYLLCTSDEPVRRDGARLTKPSRSKMIAPFWSGTGMKTHEQARNAAAQRP